MATLDPLQGADPSAGTMEVPGKSGSAPSPQSEAVTNELQELSLQPAPNLLPIQERKNGECELFFYLDFSFHLVKNVSVWESRLLNFEL